MPPYDAAIPPLDTYPREMTVCVPKKDMYKNVNISFIHNSSKLETTQIFINRKMIYSYNEIINNNLKNNQLIQ